MCSSKKIRNTKMLALHFEFAIYLLSLQNDVVRSYPNKVWGKSPSNAVILPQVVLVHRTRLGLAHPVSYINPLSQCLKGGFEVRVEG